MLNVFSLSDDELGDVTKFKRKHDSLHKRSKVTYTVSFKETSHLGTICSVICSVCNQSKLIGSDLET